MRSAMITVGTQTVKDIRLKMGHLKNAKIVRLLKWGGWDDTA